MKRAAVLILLAVFIVLQMPVFASYSADYKKACDLTKKGRLQEAVDLLAPIAADSSYVLSDYAWFKLAKIFQQSGNIGQAKKEYLALTLAHPDSILTEKAYYNLGGIYMSEKDYWSASKVFIKLIQSKPFNVPLDGARYKAGLAYQKLGFNEDAAQCFSDINILHPLSVYLKKANDRLKKLAVILPEASADSLFERASFLLDKNDYAGAAVSFEKFLAGYSQDAKAPEAILKLGMCYYRSKMYDEAVGLFEKVKDYFPDAYYYMGFAYWKQDDSVKAFECFNKLFASYPESELASDAKYWMGKYYGSEGRFETAEGMFRQIVDTNPKSESADDAIWEIGFDNYKKGKYKEAYSVLGEAYENNQARDSVPKCLFWQAKAAEKLGWSDAADKIYLKTAERFPYTYYGYRALDKLKMNIPLVDISKIEPKQEITIDNPHFDKYKELVALGFYDDAVNEANAVERQEKIPENKRKAKICSAKATALKKQWAVSIRMVEKEVIDSIFEGSIKDIYEESWKLSYPTGYENSVFSFSKKYGVDPYLMFALIREESRFDSMGLSWTMAHGLTQIMPTTGRGIARLLKIRPYRTSRLFEPSLNIKMGTYYLSQLLKIFNGNKYLALASYNGGSGSVRKWAKKIDPADIDEFVENIGFSETRAYVKKVMRSYWEYKRLYAGG